MMWDVSTKVRAGVLCVLLMSYATAPAIPILVGFDQDIYRISPGETFAVRVLFDWDGDPANGEQPHPPTGLFSMGVRVMFDSAQAVVGSYGDIVLPAELDGDGLGGPAPKDIGPGYAGAFGGADPFGQQGYADTWLATFMVTDLSVVAPGSYDLGLDFYYPRAGTQSNFTDYDGGLPRELDPDITFGSAQVLVGQETGVPDSGATAILLGLGALGLAWLMRRSGCRRRG
jgi:hypothetical protein